MSELIACCSQALIEKHEISLTFFLCPIIFYLFYYMFPLPWLVSDCLHGWPTLHFGLFETVCPGCLHIHITIRISFCGYDTVLLLIHCCSRRARTHLSSSVSLQHSSLEASNWKSIQPSQICTGPISQCFDDKWLSASPNSTVYWRKKIY